MFREKWPLKPKFASEIVGTQSLMIYTDLIEDNIVGHAKTPLPRCFLFISKLKDRDIVATGQSMNYQTFSNLQFRPLLKKSFPGTHTDLQDTSSEKHPFYLSVSLVLFCCLKKRRIIISNLKVVSRWLLKDK